MIGIEEGIFLSGHGSEIRHFSGIGFSSFRK
jgi:hypothetical protein